jgi:hypothetical protein
MLLGPIAAAAVLLVLTISGLSGTSSGALYEWLYQAKDPDILLGSSRPIRSDEFNVQTVYTISQVQAGLPRYNDALPGGVDMSLNWETPYKGWSAAFRPHLWGFFVLPLDQAFALRWWMPAALLIVCAYWFLASLLPRAPGTAGLLAVGFFWSPFIQWWYLPQTVLPLAWGLAVMTALLWLGHVGRGARLAILAAVAYFSVTAGLGLYAPFLIPVAYCVLAFTVGWFCRTEDGLTRRRKVALLGQVAIAAVAAAGVVGLFLVTRMDRIESILGTLYPGQRLTSTGLGANSVVGLVPWSGPFSYDLLAQGEGCLFLNESESSAFVLFGFLLIPALVWVIWARWRQSGKVEAFSVAALALSLVFLAFLYVPGWDTVAHLLFLDRTTALRLGEGMGLISLVLVVLVIRGMDDLRRPAPWPVAAIASVAVAGQLFGVWLAIKDFGVPLTKTSAGVVLSVLLVGAAVLIMRRHAGWASGLVVTVMAVVGATINPVYGGVLDLRESETVQEIIERDREAPGLWLAVGRSVVVSDLVIEAGVDGFSGFQGGPSRSVWEELDPSGEYEPVWNRMGYVHWAAADGSSPRMFSPVDDAIWVSFDSCAAYEQQHVSYVVSDTELEQGCLSTLDHIAEGAYDFTIYEVVHA